MVIENLALKIEEALCVFALKKLGLDGVSPHRGVYENELKIAGRIGE